MEFIRWLNKPVTYVYVTIAIFLFVGTVNMEPSKYDPRPEPTSPDPGVLLLILIVGLFVVRAAWSVIKIVGGAYVSAMTMRPDRNTGKPFSFWDY